MVRFALALVVVAVSACGSDGGIPINCVAFCNFQSCVGNTDPCQQSTCTCAEGGLSDGFKTLINTCGTKNTCDQVGTCFGDGLVSALPPRRPLDEQVANGCGAYAVRCSLDSTMLCSRWTNDPMSDRSPSAFSDDYLAAVVDCYKNLNCSDDATKACLDFGEQSTCGS